MKENFFDYDQFEDASELVLSQEKNTLLPGRYLNSDYFYKKLYDVICPSESTDIMDIMDINQLKKMAKDVESLDLFLRQRISDMEKRDDRKSNFNLPTVNEECEPVSIRVSDGILHFRTPLTLKRDSSGSWYIAMLLCSAIDRYEEDNPPLRDFVEFPAYFIIKRKDVVASASYRDNENLETTKVVNELCRKLGHSDGPLQVGYVSLFKKIENENEIGTEIIIFSKKNIEKFFREFEF